MQQLAASRPSARQRHVDAHRAHVEVAASVEDAACSPDAAELLLKKERQRRMLAALARLEPAQREALVLRFHEDDGAKYYELFQSLGAQNQVELLTELDPVERMVDLWKADPSHSHQTGNVASLQLGVAPSAGGGTIGVLGRF